MGTSKNIRERIMKKPTAKDIMPVELRNFLNKSGFVLKRVKGSHHIYGFPDYPDIIVIPMHDTKPVGPAYIDEVRKIIFQMEGENE